MKDDNGEVQGIEVKVEFLWMGIPYIRGIFAWADSSSSLVYPTLMLNTLPRVREWLTAAFDVEIRHAAAPALGAMRSMGMIYMHPEQVADAMEFYQEQLNLLGIQQQHLTVEQEGGSISPDRYSAFLAAFPDLDFDTEIETE